MTALVGAVLLLPASASGEWTVRGHGYGHGVGMSQWGAYGFAKKGRSHARILRHYFTDTRIADTKTRKVRVLLDTGLGSIGFSDATRACGEDIREKRAYSFDLGRSGVVLRAPGGSRLAKCGGQGTAKGGSSVRWEGIGTYRGALSARSVGGSLYAINRVGIEGYVQGVIPNEVPAEWPGAALRAQAIAARTYALATRLDGDGYDLYDDTRSQVYGGRSSEHPSTNKAASATARDVVKHSGELAVTFFHSSSGGQTENYEFGFSGAADGRPYLKAVNDPFDDASPHHKWRARFSNSEMESKLSGLFAGRLRSIRVLRTGVSPRIVRAKVVGSRDSSVVSGDTLRTRLALRSTWARFRR